MHIAAKFANPSDSGFVAMLASAQHVIKLSQQDIVVSNPVSIPGGQSRLDAQYGNGWTCSDVASEILKRVVVEMVLDGTCDRADDADSEYLRDLVNNSLRVCFLKNNLKSG